MNTPAILKQLLEVHDLTVETREEWCVPDGVLPAIRTVWNDSDGDGAGRLDVEVVLSDERKVVECFAGLGESTDDRQRDALHSFLGSAFPALVAAFWGQVDTDQIAVEQWVIDGVSWTAFIGGLSTRAAAGVEAAPPELYFEQIAEAVRRCDLTRDSHWFRTYCCNMNEDKQIHEALQDNAQWIEGEEALKKMHWLRSENFYSVRNFLVLTRR